MDNPTKNGYRYWRWRGMTATMALKMAKDDLDKKKRRYERKGGWNPAWCLEGDKPFFCCTTLRWVDYPLEDPFKGRLLRFAGEAHKILGLRHTGWHTSDENMNGELAVGTVWRLPASRGMPRFLAGIDDPCNGREVGVMICTDDIYDDKHEAARAADRLAERYAEKEREYDAGYQAAARLMDKKHEESSIRRKTLELIKELKALRGMELNAPLVCAALGLKINEAVEAIADLRKQRRDLMDRYSGEPGFTEGLADFG